MIYSPRPVQDAVRFSLLCFFSPSSPEVAAAFASADPGGAVVRSGTLRPPSSPTQLAVSRSSSSFFFLRGHLFRFAEGARWLGLAWMLVGEG